MILFLQLNWKFIVQVKTNVLTKFFVESCNMTFIQTNFNKPTVFSLWKLKKKNQ